MLIKTQVEGIVRDDTGALLNVDEKGLEAYKKRKRSSQMVTELKDRVDTMETKIDMILKLLTEKA